MMAIELRLCKLAITLNQCELLISVQVLSRSALNFCLVEV